MITFSNIGKLGRLGNQMFQYAALYSAAFTRGYEFAIPKNTDLEKVFKLPSKQYLESDVEQTLYKEKSFSHDPNLWLIDDNTELVGYFQSPKYWLHCQEDIRREFEFQDSIQEKADTWLKENKLENRLLAAVHVRRTDYLEKSKYHHNLDDSYYMRANQFINSQFPNHKFEFLIFSDDPEWCKSKFSGVRVVENNEPEIDLCLMTKCHVIVMANSSFSWWGAFLSGSGAVIAPARWFGPDGPKDWRDIYCKGWEIG